MLETLLENPGDPSALRVLSDALLEKGDPWGEAIRLALDLEQLTRGEDAEIDGTRKLSRLERRYGPQWKLRVRGPANTTNPIRSNERFFRAVPTHVDSTDSQFPQLIKGPVASLQVFSADALKVLPRPELLVRLMVSFAGSLDAHWAKLKSLTSLTLPWNGDATLALLEKAPFLARLESLSLQSEQLTLMSPAQLTRLLELPLPKLTSLSLRNVNLDGEPGVAALSTLTWKLKRLSLDHANFGVKGTVAFSKLEQLASLKTLVLSNNAMGPKGAEALVSSPHLTQLIALDVSHTASGGKSLVPLFSGLHAFKNLKALNVSACGLKGKSLAPLAACKAKTLNELMLSYNLMGDDGLTELSKTKTLTKLRRLMLDNDALKGPGLVSLSKSAMLGTVEELALGHNKFQNTGAKALASSKKVGALREISLGHNWLGVQGLAAMLKNPELRHLEELKEGMNNYAAELPRSFVASKTLPLVHLSLGTEVTTDAMETLLGSPRVATLEWLSIYSSALTDQMAEVLAAGPLAKAKTTVSVSAAWNKLSPVGLATLKTALGERLVLT